MQQFNFCLESKVQAGEFMVDHQNNGSERIRSRKVSEFVRPTYMDVNPVVSGLSKSPINHQQNHCPSFIVNRKKSISQVLMTLDTLGRKIVQQDPFESEIKEQIKQVEEVPAKKARKLSLTPTNLLSSMIAVDRSRQFAGFPKFELTKITSPRESNVGDVKHSNIYESMPSNDKKLFFEKRQKHSNWQQSIKSDIESTFGNTFQSEKPKSQLFLKVKKDIPKPSHQDIWPLSVSPINTQQKIKLLNKNQQSIGDGVNRNQERKPQDNLRDKRSQKWKIEEFDIVEKLGRGAFGEVFLVREIKSGFICVLKKLSKKKIAENKLQQHVLREIKIQNYLDSPNVTPLYGVFNDESSIYLIMEYMSDGTLMQLIKKKKKLKEQEASALVRQVCKGIEEMHHMCIIHRDIKPENILLNWNFIKIGDMGCAVQNDHLRKTIVGCLAYISPEQLNSEEYDEKIDIWSIGILTFEMLIGKSPFQDDLIKIAKGIKQKQLPKLIFPENTDISAEAIDFISRLLKEDPVERMDIEEALDHPFLTKNYIIPMNQLNHDLIH